MKRVGREAFQAEGTGHAKGVCLEGEEKRKVQICLFLFTRKKTNQKVGLQNFITSKKPQDMKIIKEYHQYQQFYVNITENLECTIVCKNI